MILFQFSVFFRFLYILITSKYSDVQETLSYTAYASVGLTFPYPEKGTSLTFFFVFDMHVMSSDISVSFSQRNIEAPAYRSEEFEEYIGGKMFQTF